MDNFVLAEPDKLALARMVYGEAADQDYDVMKMIAQTAINRLRSGRSKEFGADINRVLQKGYYAVNNPNTPYKQAVAGSFPDEVSQKKWEQANQVINDIIQSGDYGQAMFYFKPDEIKKMSPKAFNFDLVVPTGEVGPYQTFSYPKKQSHYRKDKS